jgi:hypothetical protein
MKISKPRAESVPQVKVRLGLQCGQSIEACANNVQYWQNDFTQKYNQAKANGYYPPFPNPLA